MITEWLMRAVASLWDWIVNSLPSLPTPDWFGSVSGAITSVVAHMGGLGAWFPFGLLGVVLGTVFLIIASGFAIRLVRIVASFLTLGGGS